MSQEQLHLEGTIRTVRSKWINGGCPPREIESLIEQLTGAAKAVEQVAYKNGFAQGTHHVGCVDCE